MDLIMVYVDDWSWRPFSRVMCDAASCEPSHYGHVLVDQRFTRSKEHTLHMQFDVQLYNLIVIDFYRYNIFYFHIPCVDVQAKTFCIKAN